MATRRVFSGIQPTGDSVHLGNYLGAMVGMLDLQREHECIFAVVDYHAITVPYDAEQLPKRILSVAMDYLAAGIDPQRSILMVQSEVPEHVELAWVLGCLTTVNKLAQLPTYKDKVAQHGVAGFGLLAYPVLMSADILLYKAELVPVGKDQLPHIEFTREVARAFNRTFAPLFPEPQAHLTSGAVVPSLLGQGAMSKSVPGSYIALTDEPEVIAEKLARAVTDPARQRRQDAGEPTRCNIYTLHGFYTPESDREAIAAGCRGAAIGCLECKAILAREVSDSLASFRERRRQLAAHPDDVRDVLYGGAQRARAIAQATMEEVKSCTGLKLQ
ncbi:MAG: tryptophan--tRNA ligase [Chloroflexi bacterium]|nr:tryptophan--tRNA ligase [Chloroflexota bacterium]